MEKKQRDAANLIEAVQVIILTYLKRLSDMAQLVGLEARLAGRTLLNIGIWLFIAAILLVSGWFSALALLVVFLLSMKFSALFALAIITIINFLLFIVAGWIIYKIKDNLLFSATRKHLQGNSHE